MKLCKCRADCVVNGQRFPPYLAWIGRFQDQRRIARPILIAKYADRDVLLAMELRYLHHHHPHQRIEQQREYADREHRPTISQLIANFAMENQFYMGPIHGALPCEDVEAVSVRIPRPIGGLV